MGLGGFRDFGDLGFEALGPGVLGFEARVGARLRLSRVGASTPSLLRNLRPQCCKI